LGAAIAQAVTLESPHRVVRLALIGGSLVARSQKLNLGTLLFLVPGLGEWLYNRLRKDPHAAYASLRPYYAGLDGLPEGDRAFLFQRVNERVWSDDQRRAFLSTLRSLAGWLPRRQRQLSTQLAALATPITIIWGERDQVNPIENARAFLEIQSSARLVIIPGAGHNVHQEKAVEVVNSIQNPVNSRGSPWRERDE
jgi:pimeloyl-ACP methyl ester carboxylesterase